MPKDVLYGKTLRKSFARTQEIREMPNLLEIQEEFLQVVFGNGSERRSLRMLIP